MKKLKCILLIDDDNDCNFLHSRAIKKLDCADSVEIAKNCPSALEYLKKADVFPELILLDINMPQMNAWEFLDEYRKFKQQQRGNTVLIILTSSMNPDDQMKANSYSVVNGFMIKYLNRVNLSEILKKHFSSHL